VRPRDTSKQCLRLGPGQHCRGCGNAGANPKRFADTCFKCYSVRGVNANTYCERVCVAYTYSNCDGDRNGYTSSESNSYSKPSNAYTYRNGYGHRYTQSNTKTSADSASSAVKVSE
jgi:hypothetical protein